jgi:hypothetical protein
MKKLSAKQHKRAIWVPRKSLIRSWVDTSTALNGIRKFTLKVQRCRPFT